MIIEGLILGALTWLSMLLSVAKLPKQIKDFLLKHHVVTDIASAALAYFMLSAVSKSLIAVIGAVVAGLLVNFTLLFLIKKENK
jgi:hypothetical protein